MPARAGCSQERVTASLRGLQTSARCAYPKSARPWYPPARPASFQDAYLRDVLLSLWIDHPDRAIALERILQRAQLQQVFVRPGSEEDQVRFFGCLAFGNVAGAPLQSIADANKRDAH